MKELISDDDFERVFNKAFYNTYCCERCKNKWGECAADSQGIRIISCDWESTKDGCPFAHSSLYEV